MVDTSIDNLIFLSSTDFFSKGLFEGLPEEDVKAIREASRFTIGNMLGDSDNYYMCVDYTESRLAETKRVFYGALEKLNCGCVSLSRLDFFLGKLQKEDDDLIMAANEILIVASNLYWLTVDELSMPVSDDIINIIGEIESLGLDYDYSEYDEDEWLNSPSSWDQYIMSLMDDIPEAICMFYDKVNSTVNNKVNFLFTWKAKLSYKEYVILRDFIELEASSRLVEQNEAIAAKKVCALLNSV